MNMYELRELDHQLNRVNLILENNKSKELMKIASIMQQVRETAYDKTVPLPMRDGLVIRLPLLYMQINQILKRRK